MVYVLDVPPDDQEAIDRARRIVSKEIDHDLKVVCLVRGDGPDASAFVTNAAQVADRGWRLVLWVKSASILSKAQEKAYFGGAPNAVAAMIGLDNGVVAHLQADAEMVDIDDAFRAGGRRT